MSHEQLTLIAFGVLFWLGIGMVLAFVKDVEYMQHDYQLTHGEALFWVCCWPLPAVALPIVALAWLAMDAYEAVYRRVHA